MYLTYIQEDTDETMKSKSRKREQTRGRDPQKACPLTGCNGKAVNLKRHFIQVHRKMLPEALLLVKEHKKKPKRHYPKRACPLCPFNGTRIDIHLRKIHDIGHEESLSLSKKSATIKDLKKEDPGAYADKFYEFASSFEGGFFVDPSLEPHEVSKKIAQNKKMATQVGKILDLTFGPNAKIDGKDLFLLKWIGSKVGNKESVVLRLKKNTCWQTVRNYLTSLGHFYKYIESQYPPLLSADQLSAMKVSLASVQRTVWKHCSAELERKRVTDHEALLPVNHLISWFKVEKFKIVLEITEPLNQTQFDAAITIRNQLLLHTSITNVKRTGILEAFTTTHLEKANINNDGSACVLIQEGKTFKSSGSAGMLFILEEYQALQNYICFVRPVFKPTTQQIFCRSDGRWAANNEIVRFAQTA